MLWLFGDVQNPHVFYILFAAESLPSIQHMNLSNNQKGDVAVQTKLLEGAVAFVQSREVTVEMRGMNFYSVLPDSVACKLVL